MHIEMCGVCVCVCVYVFCSIITELDHVDAPYEPAIATPLPLRDLHSTFQDLPRKVRNRNILCLLKKLYRKDRQLYQWFMIPLINTSQFDYVRLQESNQGWRKAKS